ncbi:MAG: hypothetical protein RLZZ25_1640 [Gemmatimonadota bacterium]
MSSPTPLRRRILRALLLSLLLPMLAWGLYVRVPSVRATVARLLVPPPTKRAPVQVTGEGAVPPPAPVVTPPAVPPVSEPPVDLFSSPAATPATVSSLAPVAEARMPVAEALAPVAPARPGSAPVAPAPVAPAPEAPPPEAPPLPAPTAPANEVMVRTMRPPMPERFALTIRSGSFTPRAGGEFFATVNSALTLSPGALRAQSIGVDGSWLLTPRWELVIAIEGSTASAQTQTRTPRPGGGAPVQQSNLFAVEPVGTLATRYYLVPSYRWDPGAGWVAEPSRVFLGGGVGVLSYLLNQQGEFLDELKLRTFQADLESRGVGRAAYLAAGIDIALVAKLALLLEARYQWASAPLAGSYRSFERIDLSGLRLSIGAQRRW